MNFASLIHDKIMTDTLGDGDSHLSENRKQGDIIKGGVGFGIKS